MFFCYANSEETGDDQLLEILLKNGTITKDQYDNLKKKSEEKLKEDTEDFDFRISSKGGIEIEKNDGSFSCKFGGRILLDASFYDEDKNALGDGTEIRQARFDTEGTLFTDWEYSLALEFGNAEIDIKDAIIAYKGFAPLSIKAGHFKTPFSLEQMNSRKFLTFTERALPNEFAPDRKIGVGANIYGDIWTAEAAFLGEFFSDDPDDEADEGWTAASRFTLSPIHSDNTIVHIGTSGLYQIPDDDKEVKFDAKPETHIMSVKYVNTGKIKNIENLFKYGFEAAFLYGPFSVQGEYIGCYLNRDDNEEDLDFTGWYIFSSYFLTGESRNYKFKKGAFGRVKPVHKFGAIELALRYSTIDLNDEPNITGGEEKNVTLGLNWYINPNIRLITNYIFVDNDKYANDSGDVLEEDDINIFQVRFQVEF